MVEPAIGVSGALGALSSVRPPVYGGESGSLSGAANELSSAARSLQSVQGQVSGQSMAINQMNMSQQQQMTQLSMLISQMNMNIAQLSSALNQTTQSQRMSMMQSSAMSAQMPTSQATAQSYSEPSQGGFFSQAGSLAGRGIMAGVRGIGTLGGMAAAPFLPGTYSNPTSGQQIGAIGNAGFARSAFMGAGITDFNRRELKTGNYGDMQRVASQRAAFKASEIALGATGGALGFGADILGSSLGAGIGTALGGGLGGVAGMMLGGPLIGAALMAPVNQTLDQVGQMRGTGEMYSRNAFRFNGPGRDRPNFQERGKFGSEMTQMGIDDLLFSGKDMQQIFSGAIENDLMRGVSGSQQAKQRMRQLKETVKVIGQTLGTTIQESMSVMNDLQSVGVAPSSMNKVMSGLNVSGMTKVEALQGQMAFAQRYSGTGFQGQALMNIGAHSQQLGQYAINNGMLSPEQIAAAGGRSGVNQVYGNSMVNLMQGSLGTINQAARMGTGSFAGVSGNPLTAMSQAGGASTTSNLISFAANRGQNMRDMMNDPSSQALILQQIASISNQFKGMGEQEDIQKLVMKSLGVEDASVFLKLAKAQPAALKAQITTQQRALNDMQMSQAVENFSISGRLGRWTGNLTMPMANSVNDSMNETSDQIDNSITGFNDWFYGLQRNVTSKSDASFANVRRLRRNNNPSSAGPQLIPSKEQIEKAKVRVSNVGLNFDKGLIDNFNKATTHEEKRNASSAIMRAFSSNDINADPQQQAALQQAVSEKYGIDIRSAMAGKINGLSETEQRELDDSTSAAGDILQKETWAPELAAAGASVVGGVVGFVAGAAVGAFAGGWGAIPGAIKGAMVGSAAAGAVGYAGAKMMMTKVPTDHIQKIARNASAKEYLEAVSKNDQSAAQNAMHKLVQEGSLTEEQLQMLEKAGRDGKAGELLGHLNKVEGHSVTAGTTMAIERGTGVAIEALKQAGDTGEGIADLLADGSDTGISAAFSKLNSLNKSDRIELLGKIDPSIASALMPTSNLKEGQDLKGIMGAGFSEDQASDMLGGQSTLTKENLMAAQKGAFARAGAGEGTVISKAGGGFTHQQTVQQLQMSTQIMKTTQLLHDVTNGLKAMNFKVTNP